MAVDDERALALWRALQATARPDDEQLGQLLARLELAPDKGERQLRRWLVEQASRTDAPAEVATIVSGGNVDQLINIARADTLNLAIHLGLPAGSATPSGAGTRRVRFNIPPRMVQFTGRGAELESLERALSVTDQVVITQAITGLGGVGKSQLAARYLQTHGDAYDVVAWIRAEDGATADLSALAAELGEVVDGLTPAERADRALHWLNHADERWLMVLDNITRPEQLSECCPHSGNGRVLITSRNHGLRQHAPMLHLDVFDEQTAVRYLLEQTGRRDDDAAAQRLAAALGFLPLALSHAAAYCQSGTSFTEYLDLLTELPAASIFDTSPEAFYEQTVASTWRPSIVAASDDAPLAASVLAMAAHVAPDAIPRTLFAILTADSGDATRRKRLFAIKRGNSGKAAQHKRLADAFSALHRYSLIKAQDETISVHRLVQKVVRDNAAAGAQSTAAINALRALDEAFPTYTDAQLPAQWPIGERLVPHVLALPNTLNTLSSGSALRLLALLDRACYYLRLAGGGQRVVTTAQDNVAHARELLGDDHTATLTAREELAVSYQRAGRTADAIALLERVLADRERLLGVEHPDTLTARANLAVSYLDAGRTADAIALLERVLADRERLLGDEHPYTLTARANLAGSYWQAGRSGEALALLERVLADSERLLGVEHPDTLMARANLAGTYWHAGRSGEALALQERVLADSERLLGDEHPHTLRAGANLAGSFVDAGRSGEALALQERVLADSERLLGVEHPDTLMARANLAGTYWHAGRSREALALQERVLADSERLLGDEHPDTLTARAALREWTTSTGTR